MTDPKRLAQRMIAAAKDPEKHDMPQPPVRGEEESLEDFEARRVEYVEAWTLYQAHHEDDEETRMQNARRAVAQENVGADREQRRRRELEREGRRAR